LRALPLKAFGNAVYNRPEFVSDQPLAQFFQTPKQPDLDAYLTYRAFLLATSQVPGGYYGSTSRKKLLREIPDLMLANESAYERLLTRKNATSAQHLRVVST
jgi:capsular polysaccharide export protein